MLFAEVVPALSELCRTLRNNEMPARRAAGCEYCSAQAKARGAAAGETERGGERGEREDARAVTREREGEGEGEGEGAKEREREREWERKKENAPSPSRQSLGSIPAPLPGLAPPPGPAPLPGPAALPGPARLSRPARFQPVLHVQHALRRRYPAAAASAATASWWSIRRVENPEVMGWRLARVCGTPGGALVVWPLIPWLI